MIFLLELLIMVINVSLSLSLSYDYSLYLFHHPLWDRVAEYVNIHKQRPGDAFPLLCIAITFLHIACQKFTHSKNSIVVQVSFILFKARYDSLTSSHIFNQMYSMRKEYEHHFTCIAMHLLSRPHFA